MPPSKAAIARAVPRGSRRLRGPQIERVATGALASHPDFAGVRPDFQRNLTEVYKRLARHASYDDGTTRPTRAGVCSQVGSERCPGQPLSESTFKRCRRWLQERGFLGLVSPGTKAEFRTVLHRDEGNVAAVWVLCAPRCLLRRRPLSGPRCTIDPLTRSRRDPGKDPQRSPLWKTGETPIGPPCGRTHPGAAARAAAAAVARAVRHAAGKPISDWWCARLAAPFVAAGYSAADLTWAIEHEYGGAPHRFTARIRHPAGWIRKRLAGHRDERGRPLPSISQQRAVTRMQSRIERERTRAELAPRAAELRATHPGLYDA